MSTIGVDGHYHSGQGDEAGDAICSDSGCGFADTGLQAASSVLVGRREAANCCGGAGAWRIGGGGRATLRSERQPGVHLAPGRSGGSGPAWGRRPVRVSPETPPAALPACEFIPIGVFARTEDEEPALATTGFSPPSTVESARRPAAALRPAPEERAGTIEIDLGDGTRLRVDAFVNERALRRVLTVLKATS